MNRLALAILAAAAAMGMVLAVTTSPAISAESDKSDKETAPIPDAQVFVSRHTGTFGGQRVRYTATAGETYLLDDEDKPKAAIFSTAYVKEGVDNPAGRPVTFLWNGGPGSASLWLHMGGLGPRRVAVPSDAKDDGAPPYPIADNPLALLDVTDVVFVDPVGTGYSRALGGHEGKEFWGVTEDAESIAAFIRQWISVNERWNSPKYIGGESYGTTRAAAVVHQLEGGINDISLNGIILISTVLDFTYSRFQSGNEMSYVAILPSYAATAWYHHKVPGERPGNLSEYVQAARQFARTDYAMALVSGTELGDADRVRVRERLAYFSGLSEDYLERANLRVNPRRYFKELLRSAGKVVGRLDSRYTGEDVDDAGESPEADPSFYGIDGAYTAAINDYLRRELEVKIDRTYKTCCGLGSEWNWKLSPKQFGTSYVNVAPYIGTAMRQNNALRVFVAQGYFDFATPFFGAELALTRNGVVPERITYKYYEAGHMMYIHQPSLEQLMADLRAFIVAGGK